MTTTSFPGASLPPSRKYRVYVLELILSFQNGAHVLKGEVRAKINCYLNQPRFFLEGGRERVLGTRLT